jgi:hypothetical protein
VVITLHAGTEVFLDSFQRGRRNYFEMISLELETMGLVIMPHPNAFDEFTGGDRCR